MLNQIYYNERLESESDEHYAKRVMRHHLSKVQWSEIDDCTLQDTKFKIDILYEKIKRGRYLREDTLNLWNILEPCIENIQWCETILENQLRPECINWASYSINWTVTAINPFSDMPKINWRVLSLNPSILADLKANPNYIDWDHINELLCTICEHISIASSTVIVMK